MIFKRSQKIALDFIIIGAQKSGTTALYQYLKCHKDIQMANKKELHFFDNDELFKKKIIDYSNLDKAFTNSFKWKVQGEATPSYVYIKDAIPRIKHYNPEIKLIVIFRNPIERAYSQWNMETVKGKEDRSFKECILKEIEQIKDGSYYQDLVRSYVDRGVYSKQIERLRSNFPDNQILFIKYENFLDRQLETLQKVFSFLNLKNRAAYQFKYITSNKFDYNSSMNKSEKEILLAFYEEEVRRVENLLNWNCEDWKKI